MKKTEYRGLGMGACPHRHQMCVGIIYSRLIDKLQAKYRVNFLIDSTVTEVKWQEGEKRVRPDISFYANVKAIKDEVEHSDLLFVIEIVRCGGESYSIDRIEELFEKSKTLREAFLYNYEKNEWVRYSKEVKKGVVDDYSTVFEFRLGSIGDSCFSPKSTSYPLK